MLRAATLRDSSRLLHPELLPLEDEGYWALVREFSLSYQNPKETPLFTKHHARAFISRIR